MTDPDISSINAQIAALDLKVERINDMRVEMATISAGIVQLNKSYDVLMAVIQGQNGNPGLNTQVLDLQNKYINLKEDYCNLRTRIETDIKKREREDSDRKIDIRRFWYGLGASMLLVGVDIVLHLLKVI